MSTEVIDPHGDIIVACSDVNFLVSSNALSLASPVFYSMFRPGVKEGLAVRGIPGSLEAPIIPFPNDDPYTFRLFCNLAHHKLLALPETSSATSLKDLAVFIVKYACRPAIIDRDLPDRFSYFSGKLLSSRRQSFSNWGYALANLEFMPHHVLEQLEIKQALLHFNVETALMEIVTVAQTKSSKESGILFGMLELRGKTLPQIMQCALGLPAISYSPGSGECDGYYNEYYCSHANELDIKQHLLEESMKCAEDEQSLNMLVACQARRKSGQ
ncbi:uncharacterized protein BDW70DRAFT_152823 [Aspergillus foveolatus]|uniref:uncharacterized protein n=1 Tax=Aspergillus foveolatus TaxID=210207 RepID=UPI003CCC9C31